MLTGPALDLTQQIVLRKTATSARVPPGRPEIAVASRASKAPWPKSSKSDKLTNEQQVILRIISYCDKPTLATISRVSKLCRGAVEPGSLYQSIEIKGPLQLRRLFCTLVSISFIFVGAQLATSADPRPLPPVRCSTP